MKLVAPPFGVGERFVQPSEGTVPGAVPGLDEAVFALGETLSDVYQVMNDTAVLMQELQRETSLTADELLTLATIGAANLQRWHRTTGWKDENMPFVSLVPASQSVLARATGTPRQTMRRRLEKLAAMGVISFVAAGAVIDFNSPIILGLLRQLPRLAAQSGEGRTA